MGSRNALFVGFLCGIVGVLIDVDHLISYYFIPEWSEHFLHLPLFIVSCIVLCGLIAYLGGLLLRVVLKTKGGDSNATGTSTQSR